MFNIIDSVIVDDIVRNSTVENGLTKKRAEINKIYGRIVFADSSNDEYYGPEGSENATHYSYTDGLDEAGIPGMPPMG